MSRIDSIHFILASQEGNPTKTLNSVDMNWLVEQVEKIEKYEEMIERIKGHCSMYTKYTQGHRFTYPIETYIKEMEDSFKKEKIVDSKEQIPLKTTTILGVLNENNVPIAYLTREVKAPYNIEIHPNKELSNEKVDIMEIQHYDFAEFSCLIQVTDSNNQVYHFILDSWKVAHEIDIVVIPLELDNPLEDFYEHVKEQVIKKNM